MDDTETVTDLAAQPAGETLHIPPLQEFDHVEQPSAEVIPPSSPAGNFSQDEFHAFFCSLFQVAGHSMGAVIGGPLKTLTEVDKLPSARPASDALYRMAERYPWLRFLISKDAGWFADMVAIGLFGSQVYMGCAAEIRERMPKEEPEGEGDA